MTILFPCFVAHVCFLTLICLVPKVFCSSSLPAASYSPFGPFQTYMVDATAHIQLYDLLSKSAIIFGPGDERWPNATVRYQNDPDARPEIQLVIQPGNEADIAKVVQYANEHDIDFMVVNRGHSLTRDARKFCGIQIHVQSLTGILLFPERGMVRLQAGVLNDEVTRALAEEGYVTTTGSGACVGVVGPGLGGGHGPYQGQHGLILDNFVSMDMVLANGTSVTVSHTSHPDLWWAMRGAGHNFGIVTSLEMKMYPSEVDRWFYRQYLFSGENLERLFEALNELHQNGTMGPQMAAAIVVITMEPSISTTQASLACTFLYAGNKEGAAPLLGPFDSIGPVRQVEGDVVYSDISGVLGGGLDSDLCAKGKTHITSTIGLQVYNTTAQRQIFELYNLKVAEHPELGDTKIVHQAYSVLGVMRQDPADSAYSQRAEHLLMYFDATPSPHSGLERFSKQWSEQTRALWSEGQPGREPATYVNYAYGDETEESMYGYEPWRLEKLRRLKQEYDPRNRFRFYNPITVR